MSYLELLRLATPEAIIILVALAVLTIGLASDRSRNLSAVMAAAGIALAIFATSRLPDHANLFGGMLVISPLNSLFKIICLVLAFVTVPLVASENNLRNSGEYLAMLLLGTAGLLLLVGSEELLMIFIGLELLGISLYVLAAFDKSDQRSAEAGLKLGKALFERGEVIAPRACCAPLSKFCCGGWGIESSLPADELNGCLVVL